VAHRNVSNRDLPLFFFSKNHLDPFPGAKETEAIRVKLPQPSSALMART